MVTIQEEKIQQLKEEAERKYPCPEKDEDIAAKFEFVVNKARQEAYIDGALSRSGGVWVKGTPKLKEECVFITATNYTRNNEPLKWNYSIWQTKWLEGENDKGEPAMYLGLLNGDGEEWGDIEDLCVQKYMIIESLTEQGDAVEILKGYEEFEAMLISCNDLWWPNRETDMEKKEIYNKMMELQEKRNKFLQSKQTKK